MSDISLNLDGLIAFLAAAGLGLLLLLGIFAGSIFAAVKAHQKKELFSKQSLVPTLIGMLVSFGCCLVIELVLLLTDTNLPPRKIHRWLDQWVIVWVLAIIALWPLTAYGWKRWRS